MTLQQIIYFKEIADTQSFTLAAQNLFVSQSNISHAIQKLENEMGVPLFVRKNGKKVVLTKYGETFLPHADRMINNLNSGFEAVKKIANPASGTVNITYSFINGFSLVSKVFKSFYEEHNYNDISVRFSVNNGTSLIEQNVATRDQDLAFSCTPHFEHLNSVPIVKQELFMFLPAAHPLASAEKLSLNDVKDEVFIGFYQNWNLSNWITKMFDECHIKQNVREYFNDWSTQMTCVAAGMGLAISPKITLNSELISIVPIDHPSKYRDVFIHWPKNQELTPSAEYIKNYCIDYFVSRNIVI